MTIATRMVREINPEISVTSHVASIFDPNLLGVLKRSDLLVVCTDNHSTRLYLQKVAMQYLLPLLSVGANIEVEDGRLTDISGEAVVCLPGEAGWCLNCAHAIDPMTAAWEMTRGPDRERGIQRGYIDGADVPAPSVRHLNGVIADIALAEVHNLFTGFKKFHSYLVYDQLKSEIMQVTIERDATCSLCSERGLLGLGDLEPVTDRQTSERQLKLPQPTRIPTGETPQNETDDATHQHRSDPLDQFQEPPVGAVRQAEEDEVGIEELSRMIEQIAAKYMAENPSVGFDVYLISMLRDCKTYAELNSRANS